MCWGHREELVATMLYFSDWNPSPGGPSSSNGGCGRLEAERLFQEVQQLQNHELQISWFGFQGPIGILRYQVRLCSLEWKNQIMNHPCRYVACPSRSLRHPDRSVIS